MADLNNLSESEEMYLISIARSAEDGVAGLVPLAHLADMLGVQPVSANQMVNKLHAAGWLTYLPYKGVELTPAGQQRANQVLRRRRLWEVFLVEYLQLSPEAADAQACRLEHIVPAGTVERLAEFLDHPQHTPLGKPIPPAETEGTLQSGSCLAHFPAGSSGMILQVQGNPARRGFLESQGLNPGCRLTVLATAENGTCLVRTGDGREVQLVSEIAQTVWVK